MLRQAGRSATATSGTRPTSTKPAETSTPGLMLPQTGRSPATSGTLPAEARERTACGDTHPAAHHPSAEPASRLRRPSNPSGRSTHQVRRARRLPPREEWSPPPRTQRARLSQTATDSDAMRRRPLPTLRPHTSGRRPRHSPTITPPHPHPPTEPPPRDPPTTAPDTTAHATPPDRHPDPGHPAPHSRKQDAHRPPPEHCRRRPASVLLAAVSQRVPQQIGFRRSPSRWGTGELRNRSASECV